MFDHRKARAQKEVALSLQARELAESPAVKEFLAQANQATLQAWLNAGSVDEREELWMKARLLRDFPAFLECAIAQGRVAEKELAKWGSGS